MSVKHLLPAAEKTRAGLLNNWFKMVFIPVFGFVGSFEAFIPFQTP